jgi:hypothetical protein
MFTFEMNNKKNKKTDWCRLLTFVYLRLHYLITPYAEKKISAQFREADSCPMHNLNRSSRLFVAI